MKQEVIDKFLVEMLQFLKAAKDFTMEQIPEVAKEILRFNLAMSVIHTLLGLALILLSYRLFRFVKKSNVFTEFEGFAIAGMTVSGVVGLIVFFVNIHYVLKVWLAPRLYLIEYLAELVRTTK